MPVPNETDEEIIVVEGAYKIFGREGRRAVDLLKEGKSKSELRQLLGVSVGVDDVTFRVKRREIFVVMGLSGSGKSTLLRLLNRLIEPTAGEIVIEGKSVPSMSEKELVAFRRESLSMVFQSFALMPHLSVAENVSFGLEIKGVPVGSRESRVREALAKVGLEEYANSHPKELSGGMQQRVGLARALCVSPSIILMDEAFSALDPINRREMQDELLKIHSWNSATIVFISHDLHEAMRIADRIAIMEEGRILQIGTPIEILQHPMGDRVSRFFDGFNPLAFLKVADAPISQSHFITLAKTSPRKALSNLEREEREFGVVTDERGLFCGVVSKSSLQRVLTEGNEESDLLTSAYLKEPLPIYLHDVLQKVPHRFVECTSALPIVDKEGKYVGALSQSSFLNALDIDYLR